MAAKPTPTDDTAAIIEHFTALPFAQQREVLIACQAVVAEAAAKERTELLARLAELDALAGVPNGSATNQAGVREGQPRGPVAPKYRSLKDPSAVWSGRGGTPRWLIAEMEETGKPKDTFLIPTE